MPVVATGLHRLSDEEFGRTVYHVMGCIFQIHSEIGRYFDESVYKNALADRLPGIQLEVPIEVLFDDFKKTYFLDVVADSGAVFEIKAADTLMARHRSQLLNYLLLSDLPHGKLVNVRAEQVQHEFVNATLRLSDRRQFKIDDRGWRDAGNPRLREWVSSLIRDLGTCLDRTLYEGAITHFLGGDEQVIHEVPVQFNGKVVGTQRFRLVEPDVAFKVTTLNSQQECFHDHARRILAHTGLIAIQWINIDRHGVSFTTIR